MAENNFLVFDENANTIMADADYKIATQRLGGVTPGIADPTLHNKLYRQASIMAAALAQVVSDNGFDATDEDKAQLAQNISNALLHIIKVQFAGTIDDATTPVDTGSIETLTGGLAAQVKAIIGGTGWKDTPDVNLANVKANYITGVTGSNAAVTVTKGNGTTSSFTINKVAQLKTARTINVQDATAAHTGTGASFDGSGNATIKLPATISAALVGNADTATKLKTARTINGVSFDGSKNITISDAAIASYSVSNANSWWVKFAGTPGLIIQGGNAVKTSWTFPVSFPSACCGVMFSVNSGTSTFNWYTQDATLSWSKTACSIGNSGTSHIGKIAFNLMAIGY